MKLKKLTASLLIITMALSFFGGVGVIASAEDINFGLNIVAGTLVFENDSQYPWTYDTTYIGHYGASSGNTGVADSSSTVSLTATFAEGYGISFFWKISSQEKWDTFTFAIDGEPMETISGNLDWAQKIIAVPAGEHTLTWTYTKDDRYNLYNDKAYLDEVEIVRVNSNAHNISTLLCADGSLAFENDKVNPWLPSTVGNIMAAKSNTSGKGDSESAITLKQTLQKDEVLTFYWKSDCENVWDRLIFEVNGKEEAFLTGVSSYQQKKYVIPEDGEYTFRWIYKKDSTVDRGADCAYLANISLGKYIDVTGISVMNRTTVAVGGNATVVHTVKPTTATNSAVIWSSSDESIATVNEKGIVTGVSVGEVTITGTTVEGGFSKSCTLTVTEMLGDITYYVNPQNGRDSNKGTSEGAAVKTLAKGIELAQKNLGKRVTVILMADAYVSAPLKLDGITVNVKAKSGNTFKISRANGYTGHIFNVAIGGTLYLGNTGGDGGIVLGVSEAAAPALLLDMGRAYLYDGSSIVGNTSSVSGAGVYINEGEFYAVGGSVRDNTTSRYGGGIYVEGGKAVIYPSAFVTNNSALIYGGGIYVTKEGKLEVLEGAVEENGAAQGYPDICYESELPTSDKEYTSADGRFTYRINYDLGGAEIIGWTPLAEDTLEGIAAYKAEVPSVIDSYRVVSIGKNAFREYPDTEYHLGSVTLPTSVKSIGYGSFRDCDMLTSIDFGGTESIGDYAFYMCDGLEGISIPESINSVGYGAFSYCSKLIKAELLGTQTAIGGYCFYMTPESFTIRGYYPSTAYSYALENSHAFEDIIPYEAPVINGVTEGEKLNVAEFAEGIVISWTSPYECSALLNGEKYPAGTAITSPGEYTFTVSDGRTEASVSFTVFYLKKIIPGDYDGDEEITVSDALLTLRVAVGITEVTEDILLKADMDADGIISVTDALTVLRIAIKLDEPREPFYPEQGE